MASGPLVSKLDDVYNHALPVSVYVPPFLAYVEGQFPGLDDFAHKSDRRHLTRPPPLTDYLFRPLALRAFSVVLFFRGYTKQLLGSSSGTGLRFQGAHPQAHTHELVPTSAPRTVYLRGPQLPGIEADDPEEFSKLVLTLFVPYPFPFNHDPDNTPGWGDQQPTANQELCSPYFRSGLAHQATFAAALESKRVVLLGVATRAIEASVHKHHNPVVADFLCNLKAMNCDLDRWRKGNRLVSDYLGPVTTRCLSCIQL
jgi:hypothetical protein